MRESFIFYRSFYEGIKELPIEQQAQVISAIMQYQFEDINPDINGIAKGIFSLIKPQLDANNYRYENGCKGGAPKGNSNAKKQPKNNLETTKKQPKNNRKTTEKQPNENENENENENVNDNVNVSIGHTHNTKFKKPTIEEVKSYCEERQNNVNPERFIDYYSANGWKVGKNPMKDWKACVRTWEQRETEDPAPARELTTEERVKEMLKYATR